MTAERGFINVDIADVWLQPTRKKYRTSLAFGDEVDVRDITSKHVEVDAVRFDELADGSIRPRRTRGFIVPTKKSKIKPKDVVRSVGESRLLKVDFVDVQQGDGTVIETCQGKVMLIDGGDNQLFARYLAGRFRGTSADNPQEIDCILVSHGDADHFKGVTRIFKSEAEPFDKQNQWKRIFIRPARVYHNGLVKRPGTKLVGGERVERPDREMFGATKKKNGRTVITALEEDLLDVDRADMNSPFRDWKTALRAWARRGDIQFLRLREGDHDAFDFLKEDGVKAEVLGPMVTHVDGKEGLEFLGKPSKGPHLAAPQDDTRFGGLSASHTINGHSVILRLRYGFFRFLFAGDLNHESEKHLLEQRPRRLRAEVFKVPHHGSADFDPDFIKAVSPVVSVVSSGDESASKEHIHPRATLVGALGRFSRSRTPIILVTEMVAFFKVEGYVSPQWHNMSASGVKEANKRGPKKKLVYIPDRGKFFSFSRSAFGTVRVRTDGSRLIVYTNSGQDDMKEVYAYTAKKLGDMKPAAVKRA